MLPSIQDKGEKACCDKHRGISFLRVVSSFLAASRVIYWMTFSRRATGVQKQPRDDGTAPF